MGSIAFVTFPAGDYEAARSKCSGVAWVNLDLGHRQCFTSHNKFLLCLGVNCRAAALRSLYRRIFALTTGNERKYSLFFFFPFPWKCNTFSLTENAERPIETEAARWTRLDRTRANFTRANLIYRGYTNQRVRKVKRQFNGSLYANVIIHMFVRATRCARVYVRARGKPREPRCLRRTRRRSAKRAKLE